MTSTSMLMRPQASTTLTVTAASTPTPLALPGDLLDPGFVKEAFNPTLLIGNVGAAEAFIELGSSTVVALAPGADGVLHSTPIQPGVVLSFSLNLSDTNLAAICAAGQSTVLRITTAKGGI